MSSPACPHFSPKIITVHNVRKVMTRRRSTRVITRVTRVRKYMTNVKTHGYNVMIVTVSFVDRNVSTYTRKQQRRETLPEGHIADV